MYNTLNLQCGTLFSPFWQWELWQILWTASFFLIWSIRDVSWMLLRFSAISSAILLSYGCTPFQLWQTNYCLLMWNASLLVQQSRKVTTDSRFKNSNILRNTDRFTWLWEANQNCVNSFGKGLNVTDIHLYTKVPHSSFKNEHSFAEQLLWFIIKTVEQ